MSRSWLNVATAAQSVDLPVRADPADVLQIPARADVAQPQLRSPGGTAQTVSGIRDSPARCCLPTRRAGNGYGVRGRDVGDVTEDAGWDEARRGESPTERLDRNWSDLLQELRVVQTGVQFLTGFLLTLPFQQRFTVLNPHSQDVYLATVAAAVSATAALVAPVSIHRLLFRRHARLSLVTVTHRCALVGIALLGLAVCGVVYVIVALVVGVHAASIACAITAVGYLGAWLGLPMLVEQRQSAIQ
jgi:hypothetical protein